MANGRSINIKYPFSDSAKGYFLSLNEIDADAIKSDLMHLLLTRKGQRLYMPNFGTDILKYIFEPNDRLTLGAIKDEISITVKKYLPNLIINDISVTQSEDNDYTAIIRVDYTITSDVFNTVDYVIVTV